MSVLQRVDELLKQIRLGDGMGARLARGAVQSMIVLVSGAALSMAVQVVLARALGTRGYGEYAYVQSWLQVAAMLATLQYDVCATRFVAEYRSTASHGLLRGFVRHAFAMALKGSAVVALLSAVLITLLRSRIPADVVGPALVATMFVPAYALQNVGAAVMQGLHHVLRAQVPFNILRPIFLAVGIGVFWWIGSRQVTATQGVIAGGIALAVTATVTLLLLRRVYPTDAAEATPDVRRQLWFSTAMGVLPVAVAQLVLSQQADVLLVGTLITREAAGVYGVAGQLASIVGFASNAVTFLGAPTFSGLYAKKEIGNLQRAVRIVGRINLALSLPIIVVLVAFGPWILHLYGPGFVGAYVVMLILLLAHLSHVIVGAHGGFLLTMTGRERLASVVAGTGAIINVVLALILTPRYGIVGTATATALVAIGRALALQVIVRQSIGISPFPW